MPNNQQNGKPSGMWGSRFSKSLDEHAIRLSYSLDFDFRLFPYDIAVNRAHVSGLKRSGLLTEDEAKQLQAALDDVLEAADTEPGFFEADDEDIHSFVERKVIDICGDLGKKMHTGKSRNDQVITDMRLLMKESSLEIQDLICAIMKQLVRRASESLDVLFPGFTHFQVGQPVTLAHHFLAYFYKLERDLERFQLNFRTIDVCPLGSGALAGNSYGIDREQVAMDLGFSQVSFHSMDAVSDRDFIVEFLSAASLCMTHLSRFCEELVLWSSPLIGFITMGDAYTTGSSLMPQKKNPDMAELIRGKGGRVLGHLVSMHYILKALPLTYNRDLQEDKELTFDTIDTLCDVLACFDGMLSSITFDEDRIRASLESGHILATDFADYLVHLGIPFRQAHEITGRVVQLADDKGCNIHELDLADFQKVDSRIGDEVKGWLTLNSSVERKQGIGGTSKESVQSNISQIKERYSW